MSGKIRYGAAAGGGTILHEGTGGGDATDFFTAILSELQSAVRPGRYQGTIAVGGPYGILGDRPRSGGMNDSHIRPDYR